MLSQEAVDTNSMQLATVVVVSSPFLRPLLRSPDALVQFERAITRVYPMFGQKDDVSEP